MRSRGGHAGGRPPLPEVLEAATEAGAAEGDDRVCAVDGPEHATRFQAQTDGRLQPDSTTEVEVHRPAAWNSP